jgi:hypothetical protein
LEGIVHGHGYNPGGQGKQFLGAALECSDGTVWVIDYGEQSPYQAFAGRRVVVSGEPCKPPVQHLIAWHGAKRLGHCRVSMLRLAEPTPDAWLMEVGAGRDLAGRLERGTHATGESELSFVTEKGDTFAVVNVPAGKIIGRTIQATAYPVVPSPSLRKATEQFLWVICPCSSADIWKWRSRANAGLPSDIYADAESGQLRLREAAAEPSPAADGGRDLGSS